MYENEIVEVSDRDIKDNFETFKVMFCTECNHSYEMVKNVVNYYIDFPTYGLARETCGNCK